MKTLIALIALTAFAFVAQAQTTNVLTIKITYDTITASATNTVTATLKLDGGGSKKDQNRLAGVQYAFKVYTNSLATNVVAMPFDNWFKTNVVLSIVDNYAGQKQAADNAVLAQKIQLLLTSQSDLLTASDLSNLATIAAKAQ